VRDFVALVRQELRAQRIKKADDHPLETPARAPR
jgi:hypothetical protein